MDARLEVAAARQFLFRCCVQLILTAQILADADLRVGLMLAGRSLCLLCLVHDIRHGYRDLSAVLRCFVGALCLCDRRRIKQERAENDSR